MSSLLLQWSPYALLPVLTATLATVMVARLSSERRYQSVMLLRGLLFAIAIWSLGNAAETVAASIAGKLLGVRIAYLGVVAVPVLFFLWLCAYLEHLPGRKRWTAASLAVLPLLTWVLALTSDSHELMWYDLSLVTHEEFVDWQASRGVAWRIQLFYGYGLIVASWVLLAFEYVTARWPRQHTLLLFFASCIPVIPSLIYVSGVSEPLLRADLTPSAFALSVAWLATIAEDPLQRRLPLSHAGIIASIRQPILVTDANGRIAMSNPSAASLLDRTSEALEGEDARTLLPFDALSEGANGTYRMYAHGEARMVEARLAPVKDRWRQSLGWIIQLADRTEEVRLEQATERAVVTLAARADALEEAGRAKTSFLATVSHELRTPLGAIIGFAELVKDGMAGALTEAERETATEIHETGTDLLRQVNSLLDLEKSEAGALSLRADSVDIDRIAIELQHGFRRRAMRAEVALEITPPATGQRYVLDAAKIRQMLSNMLGFLLGRTPGGGRIRIAIAIRGGVLDIRCTQTGEGVEAPEVKALLEPFWQASGEESGAVGNRELSLGMALVFRLVDLHGGRLDVAQVDTQTATYHLKIPQLDASDSKGVRPLALRDSA